MGYSSPTVNLRYNNGFCTFNFVMSNEVIWSAIKCDTNGITFCCCCKTAATANFDIIDSLSNSNLCSIDYLNNSIHLLVLLCSD